MTKYLIYRHPNIYSNPLSNTLTNIQIILALAQGFHRGQLPVMFLHENVKRK